MICDGPTVDVADDFASRLYWRGLQDIRMVNFEVTKFAFRIRTRTGSLVDRLSIHGRDRDDATRKLMQMYPGCEILETWIETPQIRTGSYSLDDVVDLIVPPRT